MPASADLARNVGAGRGGRRRDGVPMMSHGVMNMTLYDEINVASPNFPGFRCGYKEWEESGVSETWLPRNRGNCRKLASRSRLKPLLDVWKFVSIW